MYDSVRSTSPNENGLPRIPVDLSKHKLPIALHWIPIVLTSGVLPIVGYFALHYGTNLELNIVFAPWLGLMGVVSLYSLLTRTWAIFKRNSTCRPLGATSRWALDYFGWNFWFGFVVLTIFISLGISLKSIVVVSLPTSILLLYVSLELVFSTIGVSTGMKAPFRFSSVGRGETMRPGSYVIAEDIVSVDGKQGQEFRKAWSDRYEASAPFRSLLWQLDLLWGTTGLAIVAAIWGIVFGVSDHREVGYTIGWALPWVWAAVMTLVTIRMAKAMLRQEEKMYSRGVPV